MYVTLKAEGLENFSEETKCVLVWVVSRGKWREREIEIIYMLLYQSTDKSYSGVILIFILRLTLNKKK